MDEDLKWIIGITVSVGMVLLTTAVGGFWKVVAMIRQVEREAEDESKTLHSRINRLNERVVQKDDLAALQTRMETMNSEVRKELRDTTTQVTERLDRLIGQIGNSN